MRVGNYVCQSAVFQEGGRIHGNGVGVRISQRKGRKIRSHPQPFQVPLKLPLRHQFMKLERPIVPSAKSTKRATPFLGLFGRFQVDDTCLEAVQSFLVWARRAFSLSLPMAQQICSWSILVASMRMMFMLSTFALKKILEKICKKTSF